MKTVLDALVFRHQAQDESWADLLPRRTGSPLGHGGGTIRTSSSAEAVTRAEASGHQLGLGWDVESTPSENQATAMSSLSAENVGG